MITYRSDGFGLKTLFVWNGSAVFRAIIPATFSTGFLVLYDHIFGDRLENRATIVHPYALAVFVVILGFLLVFRLNYSYHRVSVSASFHDDTVLLGFFVYEDVANRRVD